MDGTIRYCVVKKYKGLLIKKHKNNAHLLIVPVAPKKYMYLILVGQLMDEDDSYIAQLLVKVPEESIDDLINGEYEYFKDRFVEVESIKCHSKNPSPGRYNIILSKKGFNIRSNLEISYHLEYSTNDKRYYLIKGDLNLVTGEITEKDVKMTAAKQVAFMGNKKRFEEIKKIKSTRRFKYYHD